MRRWPNPADYLLRSRTPATIEEIAKAPVGAILVTEDGVLSWRKYGLAKTDWEMVGRESERGSRTFVAITKRLHQERLFFARAPEGLQGNPKEPPEEHILYHGTNDRIRKFDPGMSVIKGGIWFGPSYEDVLSGDVGIEPPRFIITARIRPKKKYAAAAGFMPVYSSVYRDLRAQGYDSIYWPDMYGSSYWVVLDPKIIKILKVEEVRPEY